jgi:UDP-N-acetylglucosamine diphosphorylase / glucose-1-phosphate thymidylyltransferase / UDP-N-acetylgalactosamine diphosphorylase / glucosamine-1-phosphate N-acetyltransferase / galactosamine-1-phosphate N-acetyltransferase
MIFLDDSAIRENLFPLTHTRHAACIRIGILTIQQKWELLLGQEVFLEQQENRVAVPANIIPTANNFEKILEQIKAGDQILPTENISIIKYPWDIFLHGDAAIREDFLLLTINKKSNGISSTNKIIEGENIFVGSNVQIEHCILNASTGPIYIDDNAIIQEGSMVRGPFYLGKNSTVKMGAKIYGATSIGHNCIVGGEIKNSTILDNSNKAHDGYLGDSVLGAWCNLGAGTSNSNVKNTASNVQMQLQHHLPAIHAGAKAGLIMGDYSRAAINTSFNTGTVVGVCCNVFGNNNPPKFIPNFTWGNEDYELDKAIEHINNWMVFKKQSIAETEIETLKNLYSQK